MTVNSKTPSMDELLPVILNSLPHPLGEDVARNVAIGLELYLEFRKPTSGDITLTAEEAAWLKVLLDASVPREQGGPMDWEGAGRRVAESYLGFRERCRCTGEQLIADSGVPYEPGCAVHDPDLEEV